MTTFGYKDNLLYIIAISILTIELGNQSKFIENFRIQQSNKTQL